VVGGTGPTGLPIVDGLVERGYDVTILHRGLHEHPETPASVTHLHADPYDERSLQEALDGRIFDLAVVMYGRLRRVAEILRGKVGRVVSVGGVPAYLGWMNPWAHHPAGLPVPVEEGAPTVAEPAQDEKGYRIARTEEVLFDLLPDAAHFRYPYVYGPYQLVPREWLIVRRILDGRGRVIVADEGLTLHHHGYTRNLAHALLLAVDQPERAAGKVFNCGDEEVLSVRQVIELIAEELGHDLEIVSMPYEIALPARPLLTQPLPTHRVLDLTRLKSDLGYRDQVPARQAIGDTARWLLEHRPAPGGAEEVVLADPFAYDAEDRLIEAWHAARAGMARVDFDPLPGYGLAYSGPGGRPRSNKEFVP